MSWNPNQGQDPNQPGQYGGYAPPQHNLSQQIPIVSRSSQDMASNPDRYQQPGG